MGNQPSTAKSGLDDKSSNNTTVLAEYINTIASELIRGQDFRDMKNLLDPRKCNDLVIMTADIFEKYLIEEDSYRDDVKNLKIKDEKISAKYLVDRLPKALEILKKQNKILFRKNFNQVHEIRKKQFENFINSIIRDLTSPNLNQSHNMLTLEKPGLHEIQDTFYEGYKLKSEPLLFGSATIPVKNGKYPCYVHSYTHKDYDDDYEYANTFIVVEGIEGCYLNRNKKGKIFFDNYFKKSI